MWKVLNRIMITVRIEKALELVITEAKVSFYDVTSVEIGGYDYELWLYKNIWVWFCEQ